MPVVCGGLRTLDLQPAWAFDLSLKNEPFKHALVGAKNTVERISAKCRWQRWVLCRVFDLEEFVLTVRNWHLKRIFPVDKLALEGTDALELSLL